MACLILIIYFRGRRVYFQKKWARSKKCTLCSTLHGLVQSIMVTIIDLDWVFKFCHFHLKLGALLSFRRTKKPLRKLSVNHVSPNSIPDGLDRSTYNAHRTPQYHLVGKPPLSAPRRAIIYCLPLQITTFHYPSQMSSNPITQVSQHAMPAMGLQPQLLTRLHLDLRGARFTVDRETIMNLPESVLLCLFPNGLVLSRQSAALSDTSDNEDDEVYGVDVRNTSSGLLLLFLRWKLDSDNFWNL